MNDIVLELIRVVPVLTLFIYLIETSKKASFNNEKGWRLVIIGFGLLLFASIIDVTDNFESLNKYVFIGDTNTQAFLEKVVGYLGGFVFLAFGFMSWMPKILLLKTTKKSLEELNKKISELNKTLESKVLERTKELEGARAELESTLEDFYTLRLGVEKDMEKGVLKEENTKIREKLDSLK